MLCWGVCFCGELENCCVSSVSKSCGYVVSVEDAAYVVVDISDTFNHNVLSYFVAYQSTPWFVVAHAVLGNAVLLLAFSFLTGIFSRHALLLETPRSRLQTAQVTLVHG